MIFSAVAWTAFVVWLFNFGWMGGFIAALISLPVAYFPVVDFHEKEVASRLKKLEKIEKSAEIRRKLKKLDRLEKAQSL
ncbi:MAG: hypothetical protein K9G33_11455 [Sneathiella sp.]|nr:hypothetical protein [Sneathiella sp.]